MSISLTVISLALTSRCLTNSKTLLWHHPGNIKDILVLPEGSRVCGSDSFELNCLNARIIGVLARTAPIFLINTRSKRVIPHVDFVSQITDEHFLRSLYLLNGLLLSI